MRKNRKMLLLMVGHAKKPLIRPKRGSYNLPNKRTLQTKITHQI